MIYFNNDNAELFVDIHKQHNVLQKNFVKCEKELQEQSKPSLDSRKDIILG